MEQKRTHAHTPHHTLAYRMNKQEPTELRVLPNISGEQLSLCGMLDVVTNVHLKLLVFIFQ